MIMIAVFIARRSKMASDSTVTLDSVDGLLLVHISSFALHGVLWLKDR